MPVLLIFLATLGLFAQSREVDSLMVSLQDDPPSLHKFASLCQILENNIRLTPADLNPVVDELFTIAEHYADDSLKLIALNWLTQQQLFLNQRKEHMESLTQAEQLARKLNDSSSIALHANFRARHFFIQGNHEAAIEFLQVALDYSQDQSFKARILNNLGSIHEQLKDNEKALQYFEQALAIHHDTHNERLAGSTRGNIGVVLHNLGQYEKAIEEYQASRRMALKYNDAQSLSIRNENIGVTYKALLQYDSAKVYLQRAFGYSSELQDTMAMMGIRVSLGELLMEENRYAEAIQIFNQVLQYNERFQNSSGIYDAHQALATAYAESGNFEKAYSHNNKLLELTGQIFNEEKIAIREELDVKYQTLEKERQIQTQEYEIAQRLSQRNTWILGTIGSLLLASILIAWLSSRSRAKAKIAKQDAKLKNQRIVHLEQEKKQLAYEAIIQGEEKERARIARELHDGLGSILSAIKLKLKQPYPREKGMIPVEELVDKASRELRRMAQNMMPETLSKFGLIAALEDLIDEFNYAENVHFSLQHYGDLNDLSQTLKLNIYRMIQELTNNSLKHAQASEVLVQLVRQQEKIHITVEDDGHGLPDQMQSAGLGLKNIESRVTFLSGSLHIESEKEKGTSFSIELPVDRNRRHPSSENQEWQGSIQNRII